MLQLERQIVEVTAWNARAEKHGDAWVPAGDLKVRTKASNTMLDQIDPDLRRMFYRRTSAKTREQTEIPGMDATDTPALATNKVDHIDIKYEVPGYRLRIHHGIGDEPLLDLSDVTVDSVVAELYDGGTISLAWRCRLSHVEPETSGALRALLRQDIDIELVPPEAEPELVSQDEDEA